MLRVPVQSCAEIETLETIMKKLVILTAAGLTLVSVAAYAHMQQGPGNQSSMHQQHGGQMGQGGMHGMMRGQMGGGMHHGQMGPGSAHGASSHAAGTQPKGDTGPSSLAFHGINVKMHGGMDITFTGNADVDFVKGMIPHHEGAVDMAKTVLAFGKDPEVRKLAEDVIKTQAVEIAFMKEWVKKNAQ
jgi:uncharacterized protein (DUF305 family)